MGELMRAAAGDYGPVAEANAKAALRTLGPIVAEAYGRYHDHLLALAPQKDKENEAKIEKLRKQLAAVEEKLETLRERKAEIEKAIKDMHE